MKKVLSDRRIQFTERLLDSDSAVADVRLKFPGVKLVPILAVGRHVLGGIEELQALIDNDQLKFLDTLS